MALPAARDMRTSFLAGEPAAGNGGIAPAADTAIADGRYAGGNHEVALELRVDAEGSGVISGDLYRILPARHYVASFRTDPGTRIQIGSGSWPVIGQDEHARSVQGTVELEPQPQPPGTVAGRIRFAGPLEGLPSREWIPFVAQRQSSALRSLGLEIELEERVDPLESYTFRGREVTIEDALSSAGVETYTTGISDRVPSPGRGWDMAQLHTLMSDVAQASLLQRAWEIHLLLLSRSDRSGLLGIMFDSSDALPRQGAAVFAGEIRGIQGINTARKLIQTTVHELGHALNLAHRFERVVARADSTSFMNYDWRYRGGNRANEFWNRFEFTFDPDELEFLRHAPLAPLVPGGAPFHSIPYWSEGSGGYSPYVPEVPLTGWELTLFPPATGQLLEFAQPVFLEVMLTNRSGRTINVPSFLLDPKAGFLEVLIRRVHAGALNPGGGQSMAFVPTMQRCFEWDAADSTLLRDGEAMRDNLNLTFGSGGFAFAEPGTYEITTLLVLFDERQQREFIAKSNSVVLRIATPKTHEDERVAMDFFTPEVGLYLTLGGSAALSNARDILQDIVERRATEAERTGMPRPFQAHMQRAMAIDASRRYVRYTDGKFSVSEPKPAEVADRLKAIDKEAMQDLGVATARLTTALARSAQEGKAPAALGPQHLSRDEAHQARESVKATPRVQRARPGPVAGRPRARRR